MICTDAKKMVGEHAHLVKVLKSPSHKDDREEAKKQSKELSEYREKLKKEADGWTNPQTAANAKAMQAGATQSGWQPGQWLKNIKEGLGIGRQTLPAPQNVSNT